MSDHVHHDETLNPHARGHQEDRIHFGAIGLFTLGLIAVVVVVFVVLGVLMNRFERAALTRAEDRPPLFNAQDDFLYPGPRLQEAPSRDMKAMRQAVDQRLRSYGWVDRDAGVAHIPIERAIELISTQGLPARPSDAGGPSE